MDLFAYDRSAEEALAEMAEEDKTKEPPVVVSGATRRASGDGKGSIGRGRRSRGGHQDSLRKSGTLQQVMTRLQLQSHINQVGSFFYIYRPGLRDARQNNVGFEGGRA